MWFLSRVPADQVGWSLGSLSILTLGFYTVATGWACLNSNPTSSTVLAWYGERSVTPLTVALTGASAGGIVMIPLLVWLNETVGFATGLTDATAATRLQDLDTRQLHGQDQGGNRTLVRCRRGDCVSAGQRQG